MVKELKENQKDDDLEKSTKNIEKDKTKDKKDKKKDKKRGKKSKKSSKSDKPDKIKKLKEYKTFEKLVKRMKWPNNMPPCRKDLANLWKSVPESQSVPVNKFYATKHIYTNLNRHDGFEFVFPEFVKQSWTPEFASNIEFSEKAIMLCKASLMDSATNFFTILTSKKPADAKKLGRSNKYWDEEKWQQNVVPIACEVVYQKFSKVPKLAKALSKTDEDFMAESTLKNKNWGTGFDMKESDYPMCDQPSKWQGTNILGFAIMHARDRIKAEKAEKREKEKAKK